MSVTRSRSESRVFQKERPKGKPSQLSLSTRHSLSQSAPPFARQRFPSSRFLCHGSPPRSSLALELYETRALFRPFPAPPPRRCPRPPQPRLLTPALYDLRRPGLLGLFVVNSTILLALFNDRHSSTHRQDLVNEPYFRLFSRPCIWYTRHDMCMAIHIRTSNLVTYLVPDPL